MDHEGILKLPKKPWINWQFDKRNELISITYFSWYTFFRSLATRETNTKDRSLKNLNRKRKKGYRHVPHSEKPHQIVAKRNARERNRVQAVNQAFSRLQKALPLYNKVLLKIWSKYLLWLMKKIWYQQVTFAIYLQANKRLSKVRILKNTIDYIHGLHKLLLESVALANLHTVNSEKDVQTTILWQNAYKEMCY